MKLFAIGGMLSAALLFGVRASLGQVADYSQLPAATPREAAAVYSPADYPAGVYQPAAMQPTVPPIPPAEIAKPAVVATPAPTTYPAIKVGAVFQADVGFFNQDPNSFTNYGRIQDGADIRRARITTSANITETVNALFQMDFAFPGRPTFTDVWVEQTQLPVLGNVRIGQWKQPFSLEVVSSFRYTTFMERSVLFQAFTPFRHLGAGFYDHSEDLTMTWAASGFRTGQDQFADSISTAQGWGTSERVTWCPYYDEPAGGRYYTHLGLGHFFSAPANKAVNFRTIPELFIGENAPGAVGTSGQAIPGVINGTPFFVATGVLPVLQYNVIGTELLWVHGPISVQSETMVNFVDQTVGPNLTFAGTYAQLGYFLTGEHRPYDRVAGAIDRVKPFENFFRLGLPNGERCTGWGAWEVAGRFSYLQLNDNGVHGGTIADYTAGVNWYWNPNVKMVFNYIHSQSSSAMFQSMGTNMFAMRAQMDF